MADRDITLWLNELWYAALEEHFPGSVQEQLEELLDERINQLPQEVYERVSHEIWQEDQRRRQEQESGHRFSVFKVMECGEQNCYLVDSPIEFQSASGALRRYLREESSIGGFHHYCSRGLMLVPIVQSITGQLQKNYGKEGSEIIIENCQVNIFGGFAPSSQTAEQLSKALGSRTVMSGSVSRGKNDPSQSLQMMERALMSPDELKSMKKGSFIVMKTGTHPMRVKLRLFLDWGIRFGEPYAVSERVQRTVAYANKQTLIAAILAKYPNAYADDAAPDDKSRVGGMSQVIQPEKHARRSGLRTQ